MVGVGDCEQQFPHPTTPLLSFPSTATYSFSEMERERDIEVAVSGLVSQAFLSMASPSSHAFIFFFFQKRKCLQFCSVFGLFLVGEG